MNVCGFEKKSKYYEKILKLGSKLILSKKVNDNHSYRLQL